MTGGRCAACGSPLEVDARFCANCGGAVEGAFGGPLPRALPPGPPPVYIRPPRNPRQMASYAAGVMVLVSGIFALVFGNMILYWDAWDETFDWEADRTVTVINTGAFFTGTVFVIAFAISIISAYCAFRLLRLQLAVAGPVALLAGYFSTLVYEAFMLAIAVHILILSVVSLALIYYALPVYNGGNAREVGARSRGPLPPPVG